MTTQCGATARADDEATRREKEAHARYVAAFLHRVRRDPELPANAFKVASVLADHLNRKSRMAWPDQETIADLAGLSESSVKRMIAALRRRGYLDLVAGGGAGHSSRYRLIDEKGFISEPVSVAERGSDRAAKKGSKPAKKGFTTEPRP
jgi:DNA-binding MarR family transcriptional regulator